MNAFCSCRKIYLCVLFLAAGAIIFATNSVSIAQETESSRPLERIDIEAPERRPATRATTPSRSGASYDEPAPAPPSSTEDRGGLSQVFSGSGIPTSTLSLVTDKSQVSLGAASLPAQVQTITPQEIQQLNVWREPADLFMRIAGVNSYYYNQGTLGLSIGMRGFASANEIAFFVDGVPQNYPCQAGQGRVLIQWLAPEAIEKIEVIKGPFSALYGDFAMAGVINITTKKSDPSSSLSAEGGSYGYFRALGILSTPRLFFTPFLVQEFDTIDGYRDNSEFKQGSTFDKVSFPALGGTLSLRYTYYQSTWGGSCYVPIDLIRNGQWNRRRPINPTDGGDVRRSTAVMNYSPMCGERGLYATLYADRYHGMRYDQRWPLTSNQIGRMENTLYWGGRVYYNLVFGDMASLTIGGETRQDTGDQQQYNTFERMFRSLTYSYDISMANWAMFLQGQIKPHERVKIVGGVRWDYFTQRFDNFTRPQNSGKGFPFIRSPKIGFVMTPTDNVNIFGNVGCGFRSPSNTEVSPYGATSRSNFNLDPAMIQTYDLGFNVALFGNLYFAADYYHTYTQREIKTVNDQPVNIGDTVRKGYELEVKYYPSSEIDFFASYAWVDAKVIDPTYPGQYLVTYIPEHLIKGGVTMQRDFGLRGRVLADLYYEYHSGAPLYKNSTATIPLYAPDYDVYNFKLRYSGNGWSSWVSARCQPREFSSSYFTVNAGLLTCDPPPKWEVASGLTYSFW
ncbi:TonB-dependent receptor [Desulfomonile tiedjei]|uniref:Outer membrane receptor for ferrienterochelin and colicins n=1 Tax=Desulfomonile tiedjei (strain ATCC 49306 / DSM 6799 / DCB-1) TaxID=706587 RepID=I4C1L7_DESTA|nr:TonB-dependent receptor [Desulfomonile tiedjei]AFM23458.1 outer membrane receptor for ferrienterochelin and colicins [Desulfomonile tiedjei DSM 6799]